MGRAAHEGGVSPSALFSAESLLACDHRPWIFCVINQCALGPTHRCESAVVRGRVVLQALLVSSAYAEVDAEGAVVVRHEGSYRIVMEQLRLTLAESGVHRGIPPSPIVAEQHRDIVLVFPPPGHPVHVAPFAAGEERLLVQPFDA